MKFEIEHQPVYATVTLTLEPGERIVCESDAMVTMTDGFDVETSARGGFMRLFGGESLFHTVYTCRPDSSAQLTLAPSLVGDMRHRAMKGETFYLQSGAFVAATPDVELSTQWGGARTFFGGEGLFMLRTTGHGDLFFNSFGAIHEVDVDGAYIVDTGHIVAYEEGLEFSVRKFGGWKSFFFGGEGLVCEFTGRGKLYLQTRDASAFGSAIGRLLPPRET